MNARTMTPFQRALETVEALPREDQEELIDVIHRRLVERRRAEIAQNAEETLRAVRAGQAHACLRASARWKPRGSASEWVGERSARRIGID